MKYNFPFLGLLLLTISCTKENSLPINSITLTGEIQLVSSFGGSKNDAANAVINTLDGGYAFAGYTQSIDGDINDKTIENTDFLISKFSENDVLLWSKTFGGTKDDRANDIIETSDGGFAVLGYSESNDIDVTQNQGSQDFWLLKLDASGNILWEKSFGFAGTDYGTSLIETKEGGFVITGVLDVSASGGLGNKQVASKHAGGDIWAIKLDNSGALIWQKYFGGNGTDVPFGIIETATNEFIIAGSSDSADTDISANKGSYDFWLLKIDALGKLVWEKSFGGTTGDEARAITTSNDGNFIIVGDTRSSDIDVTSNKGNADLWLIKIDTDGRLISQKTFGGSGFDVAKSISKTQNNSYIISGSSRSLNGDVSKNQGQNDGWVLEVDENANLLWETTIGGSEIDFFYDAVQLNNGTIIAVGNTYSANGDILTNKGFSDVLLTKIK